MLKRNHSTQNPIEYKRLQGNLRRMIKNAKTHVWRNICNSLGGQTKINQVWSVIRKINGIKREYGDAILGDGEIKAIRNEEKADVMTKSFAKIHSSDNIDEERKRGKERTLAEN